MTSHKNASLQRKHLFVAKSNPVFLWKQDYVNTHIHFLQPPSLIWFPLCVLQSKMKNTHQVELHCVGLAGTRVAKAGSIHR